MVTFTVTLTVIQGHLKVKWKTLDGECMFLLQILILKKNIICSTHFLNKAQILVANLQQNIKKLRNVLYWKKRFKKLFREENASHKSYLVRRAAPSTELDNDLDHELLGHWKVKLNFNGRRFLSGILIYDKN